MAQRKTPALTGTGASEIVDAAKLDGRKHRGRGEIAQPRLDPNAATQASKYLELRHGLRPPVARVVAALAGLGPRL